MDIYQYLYAPLARVDCRNSLAGEQKLPATLQEVFYYHCNPAGLPEDVTNSQGEVVWRGRYSTWGKLVYEHTTRHAPAGFSQPLRMQGQYDDGTIGLYYNMFRYYDSDAGRYSAEDPIELEGGLNLYAYAGGNPVNMIDPLGLQACGIEAPEQTWQELLQQAAQVLCGEGPAARVAMSVASGAAIGTVWGAAVGATTGTVMGGAYTFGLTGILGGYVGAHVGGAVGAMTGIGWGMLFAGICYAGNMYDSN